MKRFLLSFFMVLTLTCISAHDLKEYLTPTPQKIEIQNDNGIIFHHYQFQQMQNYLTQFNLKTWEKDVTFHEYGENIVKFTLRVDPRFTPQEYQLLVKDQSVSIIGGAKEGVFYGVQTLRQLLAYALTEKKNLPELCITDSPDLLRRGFMLDISRDKVPTMKTLYQIVDLLASWKVNEFQLYTEHTFAYKNHKEVWENSSPMTAAEIAQLQQYCNDRFIDLVPNQNSFGHFENWLKYDTYLHLADCPTDCATIWGARSRSSLDPTNPASFELVKELYDELLPNFNSKYFNIGCDETVELGLGNSKKMCDSIGLGRVYLNFLLKLNEEVNRHGKLAQYWGDIVIDHDSLIPFLPKNMTAMVWGYDTQYDFDKTLAKFEKAGLRFYVCPGTATWRSIIGRNDIAFTNEYNAAINAVKHGAAGMLVTNWGDLGHWQPLSVCYAPMMVGCSYAWHCDSSITSRIDFLLNQYLFEDATGNLGKAVMKLSYAHTYAKIPEGVANAFHLMLHRYPWKMKNNYQTKELTISNLRKCETEIKDALTIMEEAKPQCEDHKIVMAELEQACNLALHGIKLGIARLQVNGYETLSIPYDKRKALSNELDKIIKNHKKLWVVRNRPGGLRESAGRMEELRDYYLTK